MGAYPTLKPFELEISCWDDLGTFVISFYPVCIGFGDSFLYFKFVSYYSFSPLAVDRGLADPVLFLLNCFGVKFVLESYYATEIYCGTYYFFVTACGYMK